MALAQRTAPVHASDSPPSAPAMDLLATTVHELRSPLTSISGQVQLARRFVERDPAREREALNLALAQVTRMDRLLDELVDLSSVTAAAVTLEHIFFDVRDVVTDAIARHETDDEPRVTVELPGERVEVSGDPVKIGRVVDNLLDNAIKYSPAGSRIDVALSVIGSDVQVRVIDRGVGIPTDAADRLFSAYFRSSRTKSLPGTGLGLHISRRVAEQHGGMLWLESSTEAGSTFVLALPLTR
jgi:two-component system phosphate regulon sensor histidine kinase PhoR